MLLVLQLFVLFLLVLLGFYVFVIDPRSRANQTFAAFIAFLALWTTKDLIFWNFSEFASYAGLWAAASFSVALLMQFSLVVFALAFPENTRTPRARATLFFAPAAVLVPAAFGGYLWRTVGLSEGRLVIDLAAPAYIFVLYIYVLFGYGAYVLYRKYRAYHGTQKGQQLGAILWGLAITGVLITLVNIAFPFFGNYSLLPLSSIFVLPGALIYAYAISNFRLLSIPTTLDQFRLFPITFKVALSIAAVAIGSFAIFQIPIVWWAFGQSMDFNAWRKYLVFSLISALIPNLLLVLLIVRTISRPVRRITLAAVQVTEGDYGTEVDLRNSNDEIGLLAAAFNDMSRKMATDIESLKRLNDRLARADRLAAMGTLAAGVAHEVNNPLASISSMIQILRQQSSRASDAQAGEEFELIISQIERIKRVTRDLTNFARVRPAARSSVNLNSIIASSVALANFDESFRAITVELNLEAELPPVFADSDQLQQVFLNLLLNARDAMPGGGSLKLSSQSSSGFVVATVEDNGVGLASDSERQIFDPFFTTKSAGSGTGLGLSVCYGIITAHEGRIEVTKSESGGTAFRVSLPQQSTHAGK